MVCAGAEPRPGREPCEARPPRTTSCVGRPLPARRRGRDRDRAGIAAGSIALIGFGADSLIECLAGIVVMWRFSASRAFVSHGGATGAAIDRLRASSSSPPTWRSSRSGRWPRAAEPEVSWIGIGARRHSRRRRCRLLAAGEATGRAQASLVGDRQEAAQTAAVRVPLRGTARRAAAPTRCSAGGGPIPPPRSSSRLAAVEGRATWRGEGCCERLPDLEPPVARRSPPGTANGDAHHHRCQTQLLSSEIRAGSVPIAPQLGSTDVSLRTGNAQAACAGVTSASIGRTTVSDTVVCQAQTVPILCQSLHNPTSGPDHLQRADELPLCGRLHEREDGSPSGASRAPEPAASMSRARRRLRSASAPT